MDTKDSFLTMRISSALKQRVKKKAINNGFSSTSSFVDEILRLATEGDNYNALKFVSRMPKPQ